MKPVAVLGAGSFGTALAYLLGSKGVDVRLWCRRKEQADAIQRSRRNPDYLTDTTLPTCVASTSTLAIALQDVETVVLVTPTHSLRETIRNGAPLLGGAKTIVCASKGIEDETFLTPTQIVCSLLPGSERRIAALSGPSFAKEIVRGVPTAVTIASASPETAKEMQTLFRTPTFRTYTSGDLVGVELGGAMKNVIAIAAGICDGLQFGHNARAALITRGLAEITRMAVRLGGEPLTLAGLSGLGDLVLTCTGDLSRNRTVGLRLGSGESLDSILKSMHMVPPPATASERGALAPVAGGGMVAEGVHTARSARAFSHTQGVELPITEKVYEVLYEGLPPRRAVEELMGRELKAESTG